MTRQTKKKHQKTPTRKIAILSDVHGNLPALEAVLADARKQGAEIFWNLGDFLGYGPFVDEVVDALFETCSAQVIGNYDLKVLEFPLKKVKWKKKKQPQKFLAFQWAWKNLSKENAKRLAALPRQLRQTVGGLELLLTHAGPAKINECIGTDTPQQRLNELSEMAGADMILCGHTHIPFLTTTQGATFLNPGSVGRPEGYDPRASYVVVNLYPDSFSVEFYRVPYDIKRMTRAIHAAGLPNDFLEMLKTGRNLNSVKDRKVKKGMSQTLKYSVCIDRARTFALHCRYEAEHCEQVTQLAQILFDRLQPIHQLSDEEQFLLTCAGILHDIGWVEGQKAHHKTVMEMILQDASMPFTPRQRVMVALIARYHRKSLPQESHPVYEPLPDHAKNTVQMLAGILRIADGLDRSHTCAVHDIRVQMGKDHVKFCCKTQGLATAEMDAAQNKADLFEKVTGLKTYFVCL